MRWKELYKAVSNAHISAAERNLMCRTDLWSSGSKWKLGNENNSCNQRKKLN
jgi:hypothetical protein